MFLRKSVLDVVSVAAPCPAKWDDMVGDERVRLCRGCSQNVYNISEMSRKEAESFLSENSGPKCLRLYRRKDGTLITKDCPVGRKFIDGFNRSLGFAAAAFITVFNAVASFAQVPQLKLPENVQRVEEPRDVNGGSFDPSVIDERHYTENRSERHQTKGKAAEFSPDTSAINAFISARNYEHAGEFGKAKDNYELAIRALRRTKSVHDQKFAKKVAEKYAHFLRNQNEREKAKSIKTEFSSSKYISKAKERVEVPLDTSGCGSSSDSVDESTYTSGPLRRKKTHPTLPEGAPIPDSQVLKVDGPRDVHSCTWEPTPKR